eukprot:1996885-Amphidinium_carterae.1
MTPPSDEIGRRAGTFPHRLYKLVGNVYGLANAPLTFTREVQRKLMALGFRSHPLDACLYLLYHEESLVAACIWHVDDMLLT